MRALFLDTETTGLDITTHEIIQIGFLLAELGEDGKATILDRYELNIKPEHLETAQPEALRVNGFSLEEWKNTNPINVYFDEIRTRIESASVLVGQNLIFDLRFIKQAFENCDMQPPKFPKYFDTKWMASALLSEGKLKTTSIDGMCKYYNIQYVGRAHTALTDCERTLKIWEKLVKEVKEVPLFSFTECYDPHAIKNRK